MPNDESGKPRDIAAFIFAFLILGCLAAIVVAVTIWLIKVIV